MYMMYDISSISRFFLKRCFFLSVRPVDGSEIRRSPVDMGNISLLGGGFNFFLFSPRSLGK